MPTLSEAEKQERRRAVASTIGTHTMEGIELDAAVHALMSRYAEGELNLEEFSAEMDGLAKQSLDKKRELAGAA
jgi:hypothetical protein